MIHQLEVVKNDPRMIQDEKDIYIGKPITLMELKETLNVTG